MDEGRPRAPLGSVGELASEQVALERPDLLAGIVIGDLAPNMFVVIFRRSTGALADQREAVLERDDTDRQAFKRRRMRRVAEQHGGAPRDDGHNLVVDMFRRQARRRLALADNLFFDGCFIGSHGGGSSISGMPESVRRGFRYFGGAISGPGALEEIAACPVMIVVPMKAKRLHQLVM